MPTLQKEILSVGEKIRRLRRHHGMSQHEFAEEIRVAKDRVGKIEKDKAGLTESQMKAMMALFGIEGLPLTEHDCAVFDARLQLCSDYISVGNMDAARDIYKTMSNIDNLKPCDLDLVIRCKIIEVQMLTAEGDYASAGAKLDTVQIHLDEMSAENQYRYYCYKGYFEIIHNRHINALDFLQKGQILKENHSTIVSPKEAWLYNRIAACYTYLDKPIKAMIYLHKIPLQDLENRVTTLYLDSMRMLALNYIRVDELGEAKKLLDKCLIEAESHLSNEHTREIMYCYGYMNKKSGDFISAINYFDKAIEYSQEDTDGYYAPLCLKIHCLIQSNIFPKARALLSEVKTICGSNEVWAIYFKALEYYLNVSSRMTTPNEEACDYIEEIAIPHFHEMHDHFYAYEYYALLKHHYERSRQNRKSSEMTKAMLKTRNRIFANDEE
ncbi:MAG: helix-turn-helix domain-containing protein [Defluviitaleaceae bacterium]|nr:helix-turn-helix domain-containing protein [Defluviitaleaceae bacterium]